MDLDKILNDKNWYRVTRKIGNCTFNYSFFILEKDDTTHILNVSTRKITSIKGIKHNIIPVMLNVWENFFYGKEKEEYVTHQEYICIDNMILSADFEQTFIKTQYESNPQVLDTLGYYIAAYDFQGIHILKWSWKYGHDIVLTETPYYFKYFDNDASYKLYLGEAIALSVVQYFNPVNKKFEANVDYIQRAHEAYLKEKKNEYTIDHYSIYDALDGDLEAIWNID